MQLIFRRLWLHWRPRTEPSIALFCVSMAQGWIVFSLQYTALSQVARALGIDLLPKVFLAQSLVSVFIQAFLRRNHDNGLRVQWILLACLASGISFLQHQFNESQLPIVAAIFYLTGQTLINGLRMTSQLFFSSRISLLKNPEAAAKLAIGEELGYLMGAILLLGQNQKWLDLGPVVWMVPALVGIALMSKKGIERKISVTQSDESLKKFRTQNMEEAFLLPLIFLFTLVSFLKWVQSYGFVYGMQTLSNNKMDIASVFSSVSLLQSFATISLITIGLKLKKTETSWAKGLKVLILAQIASFAAISIAVNSDLKIGALALVAGEIIRKIIEHGFYSRSMSLLSNGLPQRERNLVRQAIERWSVPLGLSAAGIMAWICCEHLQSSTALWVAGSVIALLAWQSMKKTIKRLGSYNLSQLAVPNLEAQIKAIQSLGNKDYFDYGVALANYLSSGPRPILVKNLLMSLGRQADSKFLPAIIPFLSAEREDIQTAAASAVSAIPGHESNLILLKTLKDLVRTKRDLKLSLTRVLMKKMGDLSYPYLIEVLTDDGDVRVKANVIEVMGDYGRLVGDHELIDYLGRFLGPQFNRRIRANAICAVYHHKRWRREADILLVEYLVSTDPMDRAAAMFSIGVIGLIEFEPFLLETCRLQNWRDKIALISLARLRNQEGIKHLAKWVINTNDPLSKELILSVSYLEPSTRRMIWDEVSKSYADQIHQLHELLKNSHREFDLDREVLREAASIRGHGWNNDFAESSSFEQSETDFNESPALAAKRVA